MSDNKKKQMIGIIITVVVLAIIGLVLFFSFGGDEPPSSPPKKVVKEASKPENKEVLSEFIEKKELYPTGEVNAVYTVYRAKPDIRHKKYVSYYKTGEKKKEYIYKDNIKEGPLTFWYKDKKKALAGAFLNDKREDEFKEFHPNGNLKLTYNYKDGLLEGVWKEYYDDGKSQMIEKSYKAGKLDGTFIHYTKKGVIKEQKYFKDGKISRPVTTSATSK